MCLKTVTLVFDMIRRKICFLQVQNLSYNTYQRQLSYLNQIRTLAMILTPSLSIRRLFSILLARRLPLRPSFSPLSPSLHDSTFSFAPWAPRSYYHLNLYLHLLGQRDRALRQPDPSVSKSQDSPTEFVYQPRSKSRCTCASRKVVF